MGSDRNNRGCPGTAGRVSFGRISLCGVFTFLALCVSVGPVSALVIRDGDGTGNTSAPRNDPGWLNVGNYRGATGIYLGNRWGLTANHVDPGRSGGSIDLNGTMYNSTGAYLQLKNPTGQGLSTFTDLLLFRIDAAPPGLPDLSISSTPPPVAGAGAVVTMIGAGRDRATDLTLWQRSGSGAGMTWTEVTSGGNESGYKTLSSKTKRWGQNRLNDNDQVINYGRGDVITLLTDFDSSGGSGNEAQGVAGDSGGAVFYKKKGDWELTGVMLAVGQPSTWFNSPNPVFNSLFENVTYSADLSSYATQITPLVNPTPGDMNADGVVNLDDALWFITALTNSDKYLAQFFFADSFADIVRYGDIDGSGIFDLGDLEPFNAMLSGSSFVVAQTVPEPSTISLTDVLLTGNPIIIPEPATLTLAAFALLGLAYARRRRRPPPT